MVLLYNQARTEAPGILHERQAENTMTAQAYTSKGGSGNYINIGIANAELAISDPLKINLHFKTTVENQDITLVVGISHIHTGFKYLVDIVT